MSLAAFTFTDRVRPIVEIGIGDSRLPTGTALWDRARWDHTDAMWAGTEPLWLDVTCDVIEVDTELGHERSADRFEVGRATVIVDNTTGWADPHPPPDPPGILRVRPGRAIRIGVAHETLGTRWLWRGFIDELDPFYDPVDADTVALSCIDALGEVNRVKLANLEEAVGAGEKASARVQRILNLARWPAPKRKVQTASTALLGSRFGGQVADLLGETADSMGGAIFGDTEGNVVFRNRDWQTYLPGDPLDGVIGNIDAGDVCPTRWERPFRRRDITTRVLLNRQESGDVPARVYDDVEGQTLYGIEPYERLDLMTQLDVDLDRLGNRLLETRGADTAPRIRSVSLDAATALNVADLLWALDVFGPSRYLCRLRTDRGLVFQGAYFATAVRHHFDRDRWSAEVNLDLATPWAISGARWDRARWDQDLWSSGAAPPSELQPAGVS